ncbi:creatininase family protein [Alienimonas chondri]|uniref:Mycofactocin system creatinine amidohydrolase family protein MftE n=1 Tax=Alienimonas chondri TaxID=2681879 RepID=A0ABX1VC14_9PLAN|nr:creatininase family protein [Alienimonas chondri]NNJ25647.1 putative mycofactocin system creatinine amidohydrolase family protein MftE [Alienimonas chondri]
MSPWRLSELTYQETRRSSETEPFSLAVLPWGATEPHNLHLPHGTDNYQVEALADRACALAHGKGAKVVLLPGVPFGTQTNMKRCPLALNMHPSTQLAVLRDLCGSLNDAGVERLLIVNGHGGNNLKFALRELMEQTPVHLFLCDWFGAAADGAREDLDLAPGSHADDTETSLMLHLRPDLVVRNEDGSLRADAGATRPLGIKSLREGVVQMSRRWDLLTTATGDGDPHPATAEKGKRLFQMVSDRLAEAIYELATAPATEAFPFEEIT